MRDLKDRRTRIQKLRELAERGSTEGERRAARAALDRIDEKRSQGQRDLSDAFQEMGNSLSEVLNQAESIFRKMGL